MLTGSNVQATRASKANCFCLVFIYFTPQTNRQITEWSQDVEHKYILKLTEGPTWTGKSHRFVLIGAQQAHELRRLRVIQGKKAVVVLWPITITCSKQWKWYHHSTTCNTTHNDVGCPFYLDIFSLPLALSSWEWSFGMSRVTAESAPHRQPVATQGYSYHLILIHSTSVYWAVLTLPVLFQVGLLGCASGPSRSAGLVIWCPAGWEWSAESPGRKCCRVTPPPD